MTLSLLSVNARAIGKIDVSKTGSLTLSYKDGDTALVGARFSLYRVASVDEDNQKTLTADFLPYQFSVSGLSDFSPLKESMLASTLKGYVQRDGMTPAATGTTDIEGKIVFTDLELGYYLLVGDMFTAPDKYSYTSVPIMLTLPGMDYALGDWSYELNALPKFFKLAPYVVGSYTNVKVMKIWDDEGYETLRPESITVQLLQDGKLYDQQVLTRTNSWRYTWKKLDPAHEWQVVEKEMDNYAVQISAEEQLFTLVNSYEVPSVGTGVTVQKRLTGDATTEKKTFSFVFAAKEASSPMPEGSLGGEKTLKIQGAGSTETGRILFTKPGTYEYLVYEKNDGVIGYTYDESVFTVTYTVTEKGGELEVTKRIENNTGDPVNAIEFTNRYDTPGKELPHTGVLWWPVPVLFGLGVICTLIGVILRRREY